MVVEKFSDGTSLYDSQLNNKQTKFGNFIIGKNGSYRVNVHIFTDETADSSAPKVRLYLRGMKAGASNTAFVHGAVRHQHNTHTHNYYVASGSTSSQFFSGSSTYSGLITSVGGGDSGHSDAIDDTNVPQAVEIWIDGTQYTATIGDPNSRGATMYDSGNADWGTDGTTEWNTGELDLSSLITWTVGEHYIEIKETGGTGGLIIFDLYVN